MATESEIGFKISGSALSFLYYECDKSRMDQVGFLIGEKHSYVMKTISDSERSGEKSETIINIVASFAVGSPFSFCDNIGRINRIKLKEILGPLEKNVCGWYIFKRNAALSPLLRGAILHNELINALPDVSSQSFVLCCIGSDTTPSRSTHRYRHVFLLNETRSFEPISVPIINLGQPQDFGYKTNSIVTSSNSSFNNILSSINLKKTTGGLAVIKALQSRLQEKISKMATTVQQYDQRAQQLSNEIEELKYEDLLKRFHSSKTGKKLRESGDSENKQGFHKKNYGDDDLYTEDEDVIKEKGDEKNDREMENSETEDSEEIIHSSQKQDVKSNTPPDYFKYQEDIIIEESNSPKSVD